MFSYLAVFLALTFLTLSSNTTFIGGAAGFTFTSFFSLSDKFKSHLSYKLIYEEIVYTIISKGS